LAVSDTRYLGRYPREKGCEEDFWGETGFEQHEWVEEPL